MHAQGTGAGSDVQTQIRALVDNVEVYRQVSGGSAFNVYAPTLPVNFIANYGAVPATSAHRIQILGQTSMTFPDTVTNVTAPSAQVTVIEYN